MTQSDNAAPPAIECELLAAVSSLGVGGVAFTTSRAFDSSLDTPWEEAGERLRGLFLDLGMPEPRRLVFAGQVHGTAVGRVPEDLEEPEAPIARIPRCDALVTAEPGTFLVIRTADCLPVCLADGEAGVVAAAHAGWRGTYENMIAAAVSEMTRLGARPDRIEGWTGPRIGRESFEVGPDLARDFQEKWGRLGAFAEGRMLDLPALNSHQAREAGMASGALRDSGLCTFSRQDLFHSHRRQGRRRGHQYTVCGIVES